MIDQPSAQEVESDERAGLSLADRFRDEARAPTLSYEDAERADALEAAADDVTLLEFSESLYNSVGLDAARDYIDNDIGHICLGCDGVVTGWCPTDRDGVCPGCRP